MRTRIAGIVTAAVVVVLGLFAIKRASDTEVPVAPGSWDPVP